MANPINKPLKGLGLPAIRQSAFTPAVFWSAWVLFEWLHVPWTGRRPPIIG